MGTTLVKFPGPGGQVPKLEDEDTPSSRTLLFNFYREFGESETRATERHNANIEVQKATAISVKGIETRVSDLEKWKERGLGAACIVGVLSFKDLVLWFLQHH
jgi:hypothetical protein